MTIRILRTRELFFVVVVGGVLAVPVRASGQTAVLPTVSPSGWPGQQPRDTIDPASRFYLDSIAPPWAQKRVRTAVVDGRTGEIAPLDPRVDCGANVQKAIDWLMLYQRTHDLVDPAQAARADSVRQLQDQIDELAGSNRSTLDNDLVALRVQRVGLRAVEAEIATVRDTLDARIGGLRALRSNQPMPDVALPQLEQALRDASQRHADSLRTRQIAQQARIEQLIETIDKAAPGRNIASLEEVAAGIQERADSEAAVVATAKVRLIPLSSAIVDSIGECRRTVQAKRRALWFDAGTFVRVVVVNVNPFLFKYKIVVGDDEVIKEASPADFLSLALGIAAPPAAAAGSKGTPAGSDTTALAVAEEVMLGLDGAGLPENCPPTDTPAIDTWEKHYAGVVMLNVKVKAGFRLDTSIARTYVAYQTAVGWTHDARLGAKTLRHESYRADSLARSVLQPLSDAVHKQDSLVKVYADSATTYGGPVLHIKDPKECKRAKTSVDQATKLLADTAVFRQQLAAFQVPQAEIETHRQSYASVWTDESRFWTAITLPRYDHGTDVIVTVERRPVPPTPPTASASPASDGKTSEATKPAPNTVTATATVTGPAAATDKAPATPTPTPTVPAKKQTAAPAKSATPAPGGPATAKGGTADPDSAYAILAQPVIHFDSRGLFSISVGLVYSALAAPQYGTTQQRIAAPPGAPGDTLFSQIAVTDNSAARFVPAVTLGVRLWHPQWNGWLAPDGLHLVIGATVLPKSGDVSVDYLAGLGVSFFNTKVMLVPAVYVGKQNYLIGNARVGDELPTGASPPIASHIKVAFGLGATYRLY